METELLTYVLNNGIAVVLLLFFLTSGKKILQENTQAILLLKDEIKTLQKK